MKGKIIVIEGTECSGKETQTSLLVQRLRKMGRNIERLSFPNYDAPTGKIVGGAYLGKDYIGESVFEEGPDNVDPKVASLYYAADRRYNKDKIIELLNSGIDVLIERYVESNMAHQGGKLFDKEDRHKLYEQLATIEYEFLELPKPDVIFFLYVPYKKVVELKTYRNSTTNSKDSNPIHLRNAENCYLELADLHNYVKIDCVDKKGKLRDIEQINDEIFNKLIDILNK